MKNLLFLLIVIPTFSLISCSGNDDDTSNYSIVGTWITTLDENENTYNEIVVFTEKNTFSATGQNVEDANDNYFIQGSFTLDGNSLHLDFIENGEPETETATYKLSKNTLSIWYQGDTEEQADVYSRQ
ncbi:hypothetical protein [Flavicella marina]|uniref:hypothetical protein n=1 Tax=Flavicella marina TaxID=1475951 RepID=UPI0012657DBC|nr:hypothetical protein [Flavicella marina]